MSQRKYRKCPHCDSKKGFEILIMLGGTQEEKRDFNGKILDCDRNGADDHPSDGSCLECGKLIPIEKLDCNI